MDVASPRRRSSRPPLKATFLAARRRDRPTTRRPRRRSCKLLALLLALDGGDGMFQFDPSGALAAGWAEDGSGLFETLVRAIGVEHGGLADVRRIIEHVRAADHRRPRVRRRYSPTASTNCGNRCGLPTPPGRGSAAR